jgi:hypothetical protein
MYIKNHRFLLNPPISGKLHILSISALCEIYNSVQGRNQCLVLLVEKEVAFVVKLVSSQIMRVEALALVTAVCVENGAAGL